VGLPNRFLGTANSITSIATSETARAAVVWSDRNGTALTGDAVKVIRLRGLHITRSAGTGTLAFTLRFYSAAAAGLLLHTETVTLAANGSDGDQAYRPDQGGDPVAAYDVFSVSGLWVTAEAASGTGHALSVVCTLGSAASP